MPLYSDGIVRTPEPARLQELEYLGRALADAADAQAWLDLPPDAILPTTLDEAYAVQDMVVTFRNDAPQGWKIGATSEEAQKVFQVSTPFCGRVFKRDLYLSPAVINRTRKDMLVLEAEFAFTMAEDLPARSSPYQHGDVVQAVATLHPAIEYVQSRYRVRGKPNAQRSVADNAGQGALVIGPGLTDWQSLPLPQLGMQLLSEGRELARGTGAEVLGDPVHCLVWLANFLRQRKIGLKAGEVVTTGTCTVPVVVAANVPVVAQFDRLGEVRVTLQTNC